MNEKARFYVRAVATHLLLIAPLANPATLKSLRDSPEWTSLALQGIAVIAMLVPPLIFYWKLDYLFLSWRLYRSRVYRDDPRHAVPSASYRSRKWATAVFMVVGSVLYLTFASSLPVLAMVYVGLFLLGGMLLRLSYLLHGYEEYVALRQAGRWGMFGAREPMAEPLCSEQDLRDLLDSMPSQAIVDAQANLLRTMPIDEIRSLPEVMDACTRTPNGRFCLMQTHEVDRNEDHRLLVLLWRTGGLGAARLLAAAGQVHGAGGVRVLSPDELQAFV